MENPASSPPCLKSIHGLRLTAFADGTWVFLEPLLTPPSHAVFIQTHCHYPSCPRDFAPPFLIYLNSRTLDLYGYLFHLMAHCSA